MFYDTGAVFTTLQFLSTKDMLSAGPYYLSRLQEIGVSMATANIMAPHAVPKQKQNKNIPMA
jgi:hypothetical protein